MTGLNISKSFVLGVVALLLLLLEPLHAHLRGKHRSWIAAKPHQHAQHGRKPQPTTYAAQQATHSQTATRCGDSLLDCFHQIRHSGSHHTQNGHHPPVANTQKKGPHHAVPNKVDAKQNLKKAAQAVHLGKDHES